jgi:hypothetical protein
MNANLGNLKEKLKEVGNNVGKSFETFLQLGNPIK